MSVIFYFIFLQEMNIKNLQRERVLEVDPDTTFFVFDRWSIFTML